MNDEDCCHSRFVIQTSDFFEKFDQFADAPAVVLQMRELVPDMAVKGKLTNRD